MNATSKNTSSSPAQGHGRRRSDQHLSGTSLLRRYRPVHATEQVHRNQSRKIHITDEQESVSNVRFDRPFHLVSRAPRDLYSIYAARQPLAPGRRPTHDFPVGHTTRGFRDGNERPEFAYNGMFFDSGYFPLIGYDQGFEIDDPRRRREEKLAGAGRDGRRAESRPACRTNLFTTDSDWITYHTVVSTSDDQMAHRAGISAERLAAERSPLLRVQHGERPTYSTSCLSSREVMQSERKLTRPGRKHRGLSRAGAHLRCR